MVKLSIKKLVSDTRLLSRLVILVGVLLVVAVASFGGYYYYDRYYSSKPTAAEVTLDQAEQALAGDPSSMEKRIGLSEQYMFNARYDDALKHASQVLLAEPDNQRAWLVIGMSYALKGEPAAAIEPLQKYVDANKDSDMPGLNRGLQAAAYYLGDSYLQLGKPDQAVEPLKMAVEWSKTDADSMYKLGVAYTSMADYPNALLMFHSATLFVPNFREAYEGMAEVYKQTNQPTYVDYALGMAAYSQKKYADAIELLSKSAKAQPDFAPAQAGLGLIYEAEGSWLQAKSSYEEALKLDVNNLTASHGLERVNKLLNQ